MKKTMALFVCAALFLAVLLPAGFAFAFVRTGEGEAPLLQEGEFDLVTAEESQFADLPLRTQSAAELALYNGLKNADEQIELARYNIPADAAGDLYAKVINDNPDLFYVSSSFRYNYYTNGMTAYIFPCYAEMEESIEEAQAIFDAGVAESLAQVDVSMSDEQKVVVLHDYICSEADYPVLEFDNSGYLTNDRDIWHSAYGFFKNKEAVCAGYTLSYSYLLQQLGIESEYVSSDSMGHAWNRVKLGGSWYNVDITFDNRDNAQGQNTNGSVRHTHLLKSDAYFSSESGSYHYGGTTYDDADATDTTYDNAFWNNLPCSRILVVDGSYYYLKPPGSNYGLLYLMKMTAEHAESKVGTFYLTTATLVYTSHLFDDNGTQHNVPFTDALARLAFLDNRFYVVCGKKIYAVTMNGTRYEVLSSLTNYCNGFGVDENENLFYQPYNDSTDIEVLDKLIYFNEHISTAVPDSHYNIYPDINLDGAVNAKDYALILQQQND